MEIHNDEVRLTLLVTYFPRVNTLCGSILVFNRGCHNNTLRIKSSNIFYNFGVKVKLISILNI